jgi:DNA-binding LytR/AlgR family response regulator
MARVQVLIVEDELIIAEDMKEMLLELQYDVIGIAGDYIEAQEILKRRVPDIALLDIRLRGREDGILLAQNLRDTYHVPVVFITSNTDKSTVERAKQVHPKGYIVKPFNRDDLYTAIEIALFNDADRHGKGQSVPDNGESAVIKDHIFIRKDYMLIKIRFDDLVWMEAEQNYLTLHCTDARHLIRSTLKEFMDKVPQGRFLQVHKSYGVNISHITALEYNRIWLDKIEVPLGRIYLETVKKALHV